MESKDHMNASVQENQVPAPASSEEKSRSTEETLEDVLYRLVCAKGIIGMVADDALRVHNQDASDALCGALELIDQGKGMIEQLAGYGKGDGAACPGLPN